MKNNKKGISLIMMVIAIVILLILTTATVLSIQGTDDTAELVSFLTDLKKIEDQIKVKYLLDSTLSGILDNNFVYNKESLVGVNSAITDSININNDNDATFYKINLDKIGINNSFYGSGIGNDFYVVAIPSLNVYYVKGYSSDIGNQKYFSITSELADIIDVENFDTNLSDKVLESSNIQISQNKNYTNEMEVKLTTNMLSTEKLNITICETPEEGTRYKFTIPTGQNEITFDSLLELNAKYSLGISPNIISKIDGPNASEDRYIYVFKTDNTNDIISSYKIDLNNYCTEKPLLDSSSITKSTENNTVTLNFESGECDIKHVYYVYDDVYNASGSAIKYYGDLGSITYEYILSKGIKSSISDNKTQIDLPKYVKSIRVLVEDVAGNYYIFEQNIINSFEGVGVDS